MKVKQINRYHLMQMKTLHRVACYHHQWKKTFNPTRLTFPVYFGSQNHKIITSHVDHLPPLLLLIVPAILHVWQRAPGLLQLQSTRLPKNPHQLIWTHVSRSIKSSLPSYATSSHVVGCSMRSIGTSHIPSNLKPITAQQTNQSPENQNHYTNVPSNGFGGTNE